MKRRLWLAGVACVACGVWSGYGGAPSSARDLDCPDFWIPPGSSQPQCLEIFRPEPPAAPATPDPEPAAAPAAAPADSETVSETEWTFVTERNDGLQFLLNTDSVIVDPEDPDVRAFVFRQDASQVENPAAFEFITRDQATLVSCSGADFSYGEAIVLDRDGNTQEFTSNARGIASEEADPAFFAVLQAACALDLTAEAADEMPEAASTPLE